MAPYELFYQVVVVNDAKDKVSFSATAIALFPIKIA